MRSSILPILVAAAAAALPAQETLLAVAGHDPVLLCDGQETAGDPSRTVDRHGYTYRFASDRTKERFQAEPERFEIQMGGGCARMGPLSGRGSPSRWTVWDGRIYIFASDACREGFLKAPERHIDRPDPLPELDAAQRRAGAALLAKVVAAHGGAEAIDAVRSVRMHGEKVVETGGAKYLVTNTWSAALPDRICHDTHWNEQGWAKVVRDDDGFFCDNDAIRTMAPSQRRAFLAEWHRHLLPILRARSRADFVAGAEGDDALVVAFAGSTTRLGIDPASHRVRSIAYRGRMSGAIGSIELRCSDYRETGGLTLPFALVAHYDGEPVPSRDITWNRIDVDPELPADIFVR